MSSATNIKNRSVSKASITNPIPSEQQNNKEKNGTFIQIKSLWKNLTSSYQKDTPTSIKMIDAYLLCCVLTGATLFLYCLLIGSYPYNSFLGAFGSAVGSFIFAANLRMRETSGEKIKISYERSLAEFLFATIILNLFIANFIG